MIVVWCCLWFKQRTEKKPKASIDEKQLLQTPGAVYRGLDPKAHQENMRKLSPQIPESDMLPPLPLYQMKMNQKQGISKGFFKLKSQNGFSWTLKRERVL